MTEIGENNPMWKGDKVGYFALHKWVRRHKPKPKLCEICGKEPPYDLMNLSGKYKRDISDFKWACRRCHMKDDGRTKKLLENAHSKTARDKAKKTMEHKYGLPKCPKCGKKLSRRDAKVCAVCRVIKRDKYGKYR